MEEHLARVRWHCRRGMLELDIMLLNFFDQRYSHLSLTEQKTFEELLNCKDQELYAWLLGQGQPDQEALQQMVQLIREHAHV